MYPQPQFQANFHHFFQKLINGPYFDGKANFGTSHINVLAVGLTPEQIFHAFAGCVESAIPQNSDSLYRRNFICGDASVLSINHVPQTTTALEEVEIIMNGWRKWAQPMFESGWFSSGILSRKYGRENKEFQNEPHVIVYGPGTAFDFNSYQTSCPIFNLETVHNSIRSVKHKLFVRRRAEETSTVKNEAFAQGKLEGIFETTTKLNSSQAERDEATYKRGYSKGFDDGRHSTAGNYSEGYKDGSKKVNRVNAVTKETEQNLATVLSSLDVCNTKLANCLKTVANHQKEIDEAFARGMQEGVNSR